MLSTKEGKEAYIEPVIEGGGYRFTVKVGKVKEGDAANSGTKLARANFVCLMSGVPIGGDYIKAQGKAGALGARLMAIVGEGDRGRVYLPPSQAMEAVAHQAKPDWKPDVEFYQQALGFRVGNYGMTRWSDLFTPRQLVALTTFSDLVQNARSRYQGRDRPRALLPPLHPVRTQEARARSPRVQCPGAKLARNHPPRPGGRRNDARRAGEAILRGRPR
jgi:putative DNA methylase